MSAATGFLSRFSPRTAQAQRTLIGYVFISPFILGFLLWFLAPALIAIWLTFTDWNLISDPNFVGLENILRLWKDDLFWHSLKITTIFTGVSVPMTLIFGFFLALLMNAKVRGIGLFRTVYYLPSIVPAVASAVLWAWMLNTEFGLINVLLRAVGLPKVQWLQQPEWALVAFIIMSLWTLGSTMIIYLAGLQGIPETFYEAAKIDGAGRWGQLRHVTIPLMTPIIFFNLIIGVINSFQIFTAGYLITDGGPQNGTLFYVLYLYRNAFEYLHMGYAAALSWVLFFIILVLTLFIFRYVGRTVHYE